MRQCFKAKDMTEQRVKEDVKRPFVKTEIIKAMWKVDLCSEMIPFRGMNEVALMSNRAQNKLFLSDTF